MNKLIDIKKLRLHLWIALVYFLFWLLVHSARYPETFLERGVNNFWRISYLIVLNYILFEHTIPFIGRKRSTLLYNILIAIPLIFLHLMFYSWGLHAWRLFGIWLNIYTPLYSSKSALSDQMAFSMMSVVFFGGIRHIYYYTKLKSATQQLRIEKQQAELSFLKSQTNPHFLFNTLNNIYSLSRDKNDLAPESILRLSKIMRFMLYETVGDFISIEQELKIISDYIELEKLRYDESLSINFKSDVEDLRQAVPPLLLIPLVENAFKHGVSETRGNPFLDIHLSVNKRQLMFVVKNSSEAEEHKVVKENIGLSNLRRQLELLYRDYDLSFHQGKSVFTATLKINLASHV
ncbi:MAG TPA: histidine kinase [Flavisolibacter sp.]|nr:histidine kinase [Flavisolibacter sp.]